ncbi:MAG TPA: selenocysteine-specific translation elongation factor [Candidatus Tumulicola sp.]|jgi:selenocysteine-specific elongation factor
MAIVGTAGHVDHGKSALVAALTGTNPDRWIEERLRGMTLDLGFAHLRLGDDLEAGIVDVPGHERFLHNMLAGATGMDVLLLVVAGDEGVMPQTLEHLEIVRYLNVRRTIVVISKIDLVPANERAAARARIVAALPGATAEAATIEVSSVTGEGLPALTAAIAQALRELPAPAAGAPVYLPIDRVFALPGRGTIVTGTLVQGTVTEGDVLGLEPAGKRARVRSIEVFGVPQRAVEAGSRVALNLAGVDRSEIQRGETAVGKEFEARRSFAVRFTPAASALPVLRRRTPVRAYLGTAEILGTLVFERPPDGVREVTGQLHLRRATAAIPGVRFVVRRPSPKTLLGGGYLESADVAGGNDVTPPAEEAVAAALRGRGLAAVELGELATAANLREEVAREALAALAARDDAVIVRRPPAFVDGAAAGELFARVLAHLERAQHDEPWAMGVTSLALARAVGVAEPLLVRLLAEFVERGRMAGRAGYYATLDHRPALTSEQEAFLRGLVPAEAGSSFVPVRFAEVAAAIRRSGPAGASKAFDTLLARNALIKVGEDLYLGSQIAAIRARVEAHFRQNETMTAAQFRDAIGTSRKYAVPLLEWLDASGLTVRDGDYRTPRRKPIAASAAGDAEGDASRVW